MTTIKFRGFRMDGKGWVEGDLIQDVRSMYIAEKGTSIWTSFIPKEDESYHKQIRLIVHEIHPSSLGMFTGRTDKNGKEIFTGDLIHRYTGVHWRVVLKDGHIFAESINGSGLYLHYNEFIQCEIIGNQFEQDNGR